MAENKVKADIFKANFKDTRLFNNPVGDALVGPLTLFKILSAEIRKKFRRLKFGLIKGSGDLIGWKSITVTPEMVGKKVAVFVSLETKREKFKPNRNNDHYERQATWAQNVLKAGGIAGFAKSVDDAESILNSFYPVDPPN